MEVDHPDHDLLTSIHGELERKAGKKAPLESFVPELLRDIIDDVIDTPRTGRRLYAELEKSEKTYIGTRVEIMLRSELNLPRGRLDTVILDHDVDIKHSMGTNWMIPREAVGNLCILVAANETTFKCSMGLIRAAPDYLSQSTNQDGKRSISAFGKQNILWMFRDADYPANFWSGLGQDMIDRIVDLPTGNDRVAQLFRELLDQPISRKVIEAVARQKDFMRRLRADGDHGTRDRLRREGILVLSATYDQALIKALNLPNGDFVAHRLASEDERALARTEGWEV